MSPYRILLVLLLSLVALPAKAERLDQLLLGPELRIRPSEGLTDHPRYELALPHGLSSVHADLIARVGVVIAERASLLAFPVSLGMRYLPFDSVVRPLVGFDS